jgi:hypothetical protein
MYSSFCYTHRKEFTEHKHFIMSTARPKTDDYCYANIQMTINFAAKFSSRTHVPVLISFVWNR